MITFHGYNNKITAERLLLKDIKYYYYNKAMYKFSAFYLISIADYAPHIVLLNILL